MQLVKRQLVVQDVLGSNPGLNMDMISQDFCHVDDFFIKSGIKTLMFWMDSSANTVTEISIGQTSIYKFISNMHVNKMVAKKMENLMCWKRELI